MSEMVVYLSVMDTVGAHTSGKSFQVVFLLIDGFSLMSYASAMEPLRACNLLAGRPVYDIRHVSAEGRYTQSSSGAIIPATDNMDERVSPDMVLVIAGGDPSQFDDPKMTRWLRSQAGRRILMGGVSGGPLILARAGLMEGRRMTVHWDHVQALEVLCPTLIIERSLYVRDRDRLTCAGGSAALDMMHALITEHQGPALATRISDWFVQTAIRPGELAQRASIAERYGIASGAIIQSIEAMENHLADPLELSQLASLVGLSGRQLNRLFQQELATSAIQFYRRLRLEKVHELLLSTAWSMENIASASGFANGAHLSRLYTRYHGQTPRQARMAGSIRV